MDGQVCMYCLERDGMRTASQGRQCDTLDNVLGTLGSGVHANVTVIRITYLNIISDQVSNGMP